MQKISGGFFMKNFSKFALALALIVIPLCFTSCSNPAVESTGMTQEKPTPPGSYKITFNSNGGSEVSLQVIKENECITKPENPTKTGYTFNEWYCDDTEFDFDTPITKNITLTARWTANTYTVTFNSNGGYGTKLNDISCTYDEEFTLPENTFNKTNMKFVGWALSQDETINIYTAGTTLKNLSSKNLDKVTIYAVWADCYYTIKYFYENADDDEYVECVEKRKKVPATAGSKVRYIDVTNKHDDTNGMKAYTDFHLSPVEITVNPDCSSIFELYYKRSLLRLIYDEGEKSEIIGEESISTNKPETAYIKWGQTVHVDFDNVTRAHHHLLGFGYKIEKNGNIIEEVNDVIYTKDGVNTFTMQYDKTTLIPHWELDFFNITFVTNGGTALESQKLNYYDTLARPENCTKEHCVLAGWYTDEAMTEKFDFNTHIDKDYTLYAKWQNTETTAETVVDTIKNLGVTSTVYLVGPITDNLLKDICEAINSLPKGVLVNLDMSNAIGVTTFDKSFDGCKKLKSIILPSCLTTIGKYAFKDCIALTEVFIPKTVISINFSNPAFKKTTSLVKITVDEDNPYCTVINNVLYTKDKKTLLCVPSTITEFRIPDEVTSIGKNAFMYSSIKSIEIPPTVSTIDEGAFSYSKLESVHIPATVTSLGEDVFYYCEKLSSVSIEEGIEMLPYRMLSNTAISSFIIPNSVKEIGSSCFSFCKMLTSITIPANVKVIERYAFSSSKKLETITFEDSANWYYGDLSFYPMVDSDWDRLESVNPEDLIKVSEWTSSSGKFYKTILYHKE